MKVPQLYLDRMWSKVDKNGPVPDYNPALGPCWVWTAGLQSNGYGFIGVNGKWPLTHRVAYSHLRGEIPKGMVIDHLCRNRACCNPDHLEVVTHAENLRRGSLAKTTCVHGHLYNDENTRWEHGHRRCRKCRRIAYAKIKEDPVKWAAMIEKIYAWRRKKSEQLKIAA